MGELISDKQLDFQWIFSREKALSIWLQLMTAPSIDALRATTSSTSTAFMIILGQFIKSGATLLTVISSYLVVLTGLVNYGMLKILKSSTPFAPF